MNSHSLKNKVISKRHFVSSTMSWSEALQNPVLLGIQRANLFAEEAHRENQSLFQESKRCAELISDDSFREANLLVQKLKRTAVFFADEECLVADEAEHERQHAIELVLGPTSTTLRTFLGGLLVALCSFATLCSFPIIKPSAFSTELSVTTYVIISGLLPDAFALEVPVVCSLASLKSAILLHFQAFITKKIVQKKRLWNIPLSPKPFSLLLNSKPIEELLFLTSGDMIRGSWLGRGGMNPNLDNITSNLISSDSGSASESLAFSESSFSDSSLSSPSTGLIACDICVPNQSMDTIYLLPAESESSFVPYMFSESLADDSSLPSWTATLGVSHIGKQRGKSKVNTRLLQEKLAKCRRQDEEEIIDPFSNELTGSAQDICSSKQTVTKNAFVEINSKLQNQRIVTSVASSQASNSSSLFDRYSNANSSVLSETIEPLSRVGELPRSSKYANFVHSDELSDKDLKDIYESIHKKNNLNQCFKDELFVSYYFDFVKNFYPNLNAFPLQPEVISSFIRCQALAKYSVDSIQNHHVPALKRYSSLNNYLVSANVDDAISKAHRENNDDSETVKRGPGQCALSESDFCYAFSCLPAGFFDKWRTLSACSYGIAAGPRCLTINNTSLDDILSVALVSEESKLYKVVLLQRHVKNRRGGNDTTIELYGSLDMANDPVNMVYNLYKHLLENFCLDLRNWDSWKSNSSNGTTLIWDMTSDVMSQRLKTILAKAGINPEKFLGLGLG